MNVFLSRVVKFFFSFLKPLLRTIVRNNSVSRAYWNVRTDALIRKYRTGERAREDYPLYKNYLVKYAPLRLLDIGCGSGRLFPLYQELKISEVVGIDISPKAIEKAVGYYNCTTRVLTAENIDYPDNYFDAAISNSVLRFIPPGKHINLAVSNIVEQSRSICLREMVRGTGGFAEYVHDYEALFGDRMRLVEHFEDGQVDVYIFSK